MTNQNLRLLEPLGSATVSSRSPSVSPSKGRMREKFAAAQANAITFDDVIDQGEVIHWISAVSPELLPYGMSLVKSGYNTLFSIAMICEDDIGNEIPPSLKVPLVKALSALRQDLYRM